MKTISISITGPAGSGKSTVATLVSQILRESGFVVRHDVGRDGPVSLTSGRVAAAADAVVVVHEININRASGG